VISAPLSPLAVIAGAGSGKSETMAARMVWLVANGMVRPDRVLGLTFTRKAAAEFADRVRSRLERLRRAGPLNTELPGTNKPGTADTEDPFGGELAETAVQSLVPMMNTTTSGSRRAISVVAWSGHSKKPGSERPLDTRESK